MYLRAAALVAVLALVAIACGKDTGSGGSTAPEDLQKGGTLMIGSDTDVFAGFDPQREYYQVSWAFYRCCLLRTLLSYNGQDAENRGTEALPDLATDMPTVSEDNLEWTFTMKKGLMYAPPLEDVEITSGDIVRALERTATPEVGGAYAFYYSPIVGFDDFSKGKADTIEGLETPDDHTLVVRLTEPTGHLGYLFSMPATAPIPPNPDDPKARLGVAEGHDEDYGRFMVASGPYMWEGSENMDFSKPVAQQTEVAGYEPNKLWRMVRNPSWTDDDLRKAYVDEVEVQVTPGADPSVLDKKVQNDELDTVFQNGVPPKIYREWTQDETLKSRIFTNESPGNYFVQMNLATPPFDDIHVRKAVQYAIDRAGLVRLMGGEVAGTVATHFVPNGLLTTSDGTSLLEDFNPYPSTDAQGADAEDGLQSAKDEMKQSAYDTDGDGICDASECKDILALGGNSTTLSAQNQLVAQNLEAVGITLDLKELDGSTAYAKVADPKNKIPLSITVAGWVQDWPDAFTFFYAPIYGPSVLMQDNANYSLIGASSEQLSDIGFSGVEVPGMNEEIDKCTALTGDDRISCWADADKHLMEEVAAIVPYIISDTTNVISSRVANYVYSAFDSQMAYDQVALNQGGE
jgi:peptide/nickel transport system substrate-binding protein